MTGVLCHGTPAKPITAHRSAHHRLYFSALVHVPTTIICNRMFAQPDDFASVVECVSTIWSIEGIGGFYRDLPLYLLGSALSVIGSKN